MLKSDGPLETFNTIFKTSSVSGLSRLFQQLSDLNAAGQEHLVSSVLSEALFPSEPQELVLKFLRG